MLTLALALIVLANVGDYASTKYALKRGSREANPLVATDMNTVKVAGTAIQVWLAIFVRDTPFVLWLMSGSIAAFYTWVIFHNIRNAR